MAYGFVMLQALRKVTCGIPLLALTFTLLSGSPKLLQATRISNIVLIRVLVLYGL